MENRGQFFLIATFIVITLFLSLTLVYNYARTPVGDQNIYSVAKNLKFEGVNIVNNGYYNGLSYSEITNNLRGFTNLTSISFKVYNITIITISPDRNDVHAYNYINGNENPISNPPSIVGEKLTLDLNSLKFNFNLSRGYNFFVIVINEKQNERYIASE